jgi:hypothetical protein
VVEYPACSFDSAYRVNPLVSVSVVPTADQGNSSADYDFLSESAQHTLLLPGLPRLVALARFDMPPVV